MNATNRSRGGVELSHNVIQAIDYSVFDDQVPFALLQPGLKKDNEGKADGEAETNGPEMSQGEI
jgi:hypothetical protein